MYIINLVMHLSLLLIKTRLKSRKLIVFIHFFFLSEQGSRFYPEVAKENLGR